MLLVLINILLRQNVTYLRQREKNLQLSCFFFVGHTAALIENKMIFRRTLITIGSDDMILCRIIVEGAYLVSGLPIKNFPLEKDTYLNKIRVASQY